MLGELTESERCVDRGFVSDKLKQDRKVSARNVILTCSTILLVETLEQVSKHIWSNVILLLSLFMKACEGVGAEEGAGSCNRIEHNSIGLFVWSAFLNALALLLIAFSSSTTKQLSSREKGFYNKKLTQFRVRAHSHFD